MSGIVFHPGGIATPNQGLVRFGILEQLGSNEPVVPLSVLENHWSDEGEALAEWGAENGFPWPRKGA